MQQIRDAILSGDRAVRRRMPALAVPESYRAVTVHRRRGRHVRGPCAAGTRTRASPCTSTTCRCRSSPRRPGRGDGQCHQLQHRLDLDLRAGLDLRLPRALRPHLRLRQAPRPALPRRRLRLAGVVLRTGPGVHKWRPGQEVVAHCLSVELESADGHNDTMLDPEQRIWGFETNFGGLAEFAIVKTNQLMPKPDHLTWRRPPPRVVNSTAYRQLISRNGAGMKLGDIVLIWGARRPRLLRDPDGAGRRRHRSASSPPRQGRDLPGDGRRAGHRPERRGLHVLEGRDHPGPEGVEAPRRRIRELTGGKDVDIVFEHPGRETFGASVYVARKGGTIVTCASTSGYMHEYDNRYLWMSLKRIIGSHFANYREAWEANDLISRGLIHPTLSKTYAMDEVGRRHTTSTATCTRGRWACSPSPRRRASASPTRRSARRTCRRSTASATPERVLDP